MDAHDRLVAGIRCLQVLEKLSEYVDGELTPADKEKIDAHLQGCDWCERFGGEFSRLVSGLREDLETSTDAGEELAERILAKTGPSRD